MDIGINMLLWTTHVTEEHLPILEELKGLGYDGVEIPIMEGTADHFRKLGGLLDDLGLRRTSSMAFVAPECDPISDDLAHRSGALDQMKWLIECAESLGASLICGPMFQTIGQFSGNTPTDVEKERAVDMLREAAPLAGAAGITLTIEALNRFECYLVNTLADAAAMARQIDHPACGVLFDTFHANIEEKDPVGCIGPHINEIRHVHISANDRGTPGHDHIDFAGTLAALRSGGYDGWLTIEAFGRALPDLAAATCVWRDFFSDRMSLCTDALAFVRAQWEAAST